MSVLNYTQAQGVGVVSDPLSTIRLEKPELLEAKPASHDTGGHGTLADSALSKLSARHSTNPKPKTQPDPKLAPN